MTSAAGDMAPEQGGAVPAAAPPVSRQPRRRWILRLRTWVSLFTALLLAVVVVLAWPEIVSAAGYLPQVSLWVLALMVPVQILSYWTTGEVLFAYLRAQGELRGLSPLTAARMSLEFNFVNHILPSGGAAGVSYTSWKLGHHGVPAGRATMAQLVRFAVTFVSFVVLLAIAVLVLFASGEAGAQLLWLSALVGALALGFTGLSLFLVASRSRLEALAAWLTRLINGAVRLLSRGRRAQALGSEVLSGFFAEFHDDYLTLRSRRRMLVKPLLWSFAVNALDAALFSIAFAALGVPVSPALVFIAYGLASIISLVVVTPNGVGPYEAVMVGFLVSGGVPADAAIAGVLLARVVLMLGTIVFGYLFYQLTVLRHGRSPVGSAAALR